MMSISARSAMTRRENHSHGSPTRRNKARYLAMAGLFQRTSRKCEERSEEHTSELQSLMRISYDVFCLKKKTTHIIHTLYIILTKHVPSHQTTLTNISHPTNQDI